VQKSAEYAHVVFPVLYTLAAAGLVSSCLHWQHEPKTKNDLHRQFFLLFWQFTALQ